MRMGMRTPPGQVFSQNEKAKDRKGTLIRLLKFVMENRSEEHTSELQSPS